MVCVKNCITELYGGDIERHGVLPLSSLCVTLCKSPCNSVSLLIVASPLYGLPNAGLKRLIFSDTDNLIVLNSADFCHFTRRPFDDHFFDFGIVWNAKV